MVIALKHSKLAKDNCCKKFSLKANDEGPYSFYLQTHGVWKSQKWSHFNFSILAFSIKLHYKCKRSSLRSQCWMRLFVWFSNTVMLKRWTFYKPDDYLWIGRWWWGHWKLFPWFDVVIYRIKVVAPLDSPWKTLNLDNQNFNKSINLIFIKWSSLTLAWNVELSLSQVFVCVYIWRYNHHILIIE